ncbi:MraY family glycosyltransferase [Sulfurimonas sp.]|uniref:MraY family glycosyltransferase n=1 Tax=Sulfurimonas sp. TaxID=2022749 RepID=UPI00261830AB|nr:MraY family glycosyltransferase [Sulfurimonas sp.]
MIKYAAKLGLQDVPNERSAHKSTIPKSAGLGFVSAVILGQFIFNFDYFIDYFFMYFSILIVMLIGLYDDKYDIKARVKFIFIILAASIVVFYDIRIDSLGTYFGYELHLPWFIAALFSVFAIVGFTNALNLMDGLDGLAGGLSLIMLTMFFAIGLTHGDYFLVSLSASFIVAVGAFMIFNWHPAKIFMGDSGSLTLGFVISVLAIKSLAYISPAAVLFIIGLPLIDTFIVVRRRLQRGQSPFIADKNHIHHFLYKTKLHVRFSVMMLLYIQLALSIIGFQIKSTDQFLSVVLFVMIVYIFFNLFDQRYRYRPKTQKRKKRMDRRDA